MGSEQNRFLQPQQPLALRSKTWKGCLGGFSCFHKQKRGKRIVPSSRIPESNPLSHQPNSPQIPGLHNQTTRLNPSLLAPPSSPASSSNSALPSTAQSPNNFLSANSPNCPSPTMYITGPYAHETQLVSPPVFSTFTTEPSSAPLTPPPELAHLTTPSSPEVPYARFLQSSGKIKSTDKNTYIAGNDLQSAYPAGVSSSFTESEFPLKWDPLNPSQNPGYSKSNPAPARDSNFFCPETFAQFYLDQSLFPNSGGRISVSRESDAYSNGLQNRHQNKNCGPDAEELEAYRASFGFSADDIITTTHYVEISDDSFSITPFASDDKPVREENILTEERQEKTPSKVTDLCKNLEDQVSHKRFGDISKRNIPRDHFSSDDEDSKTEASRTFRRHHFGLSNSDPEIEYRRGRSLRERRGMRER